MVRITKTDFPWTIIVEDKISKNSGKPYVSIGIGFKEKNKNATCEADQYQTKWTNFVNIEDMLKLSSGLENAYQDYKSQRRLEKSQNRQSEQQPNQEDYLDNPFD